MSTIAAPIQVIVAPGTPSEFTFNREHQLNDATFTMTDMLLDLKTQASDAPADKVFIGLEAKLEISIAEFDLNFFRRATNPARYVEDAIDPTKRKLEYGDLTGLRVPKYQVLFKLYEGSAPTTNRDNWFTFLNAGIEANVSATFGKGTQSEYKLTITAYPDSISGIKVVRGDITANV